MAIEPGRGVRLLMGFFLAAWATAAAAQDTTYVLIPGVPGGSEDPNHVDWIEAYGLSTSASTSGGSPTLSPVHVLKGTDTSTPELHERLAQNALLGTVRVEVCRNPEGGGQECYYKLELTNARVTDIALSGSSCIDPGTSCTPAQTESIAFAFTKVIWNYVGFGKAKSSCGCWDTATGKACGCTP